MENIIYYKNHRIRIEQDELYDSPDDWGNEDIFLVYKHRDFTIWRVGFDPQEIFQWLLLIKELETTVDAERLEEINSDLESYPDYSKYWIFPVEAYIHSGVSLSLFNGTKFCRWDSSVAGYILALKKEYTTKEEAEKSAIGLIDSWNDYLSGNVYGFIVEKPNTIYSIPKDKFDTLDPTLSCKDIMEEFDVEDEWIEIDSCWGFYGSPEESGLIKEAKDIIDAQFVDL